MSILLVILKQPKTCRKQEFLKGLLEDYIISEDFNVEFLLNLVVLWNPRTHRELDDSGYDFQALVSNRVDAVGDVDLSDRPSHEVFGVRKQNLTDSIEILQVLYSRSKWPKKLNIA